MENAFRPTCNAQEREIDGGDLMVSVRILRHIIDSFSMDFLLGPSNLVDSCRTVRKHCEANRARGESLPKNSAEFSHAS